MKNVINIVVFCSLCAVLNFYYPFVSAAATYKDTTVHLRYHSDKSHLFYRNKNIDANIFSSYKEYSANHNSHIDTCLDCHNSEDLHAMGGHESCEQCHFVYGGANVTPGRCVACHPTDDPGTCTLANKHGNSCISCHPECAAGGTTTTTTSPAEGHIDMCVVCHTVNDLHAIGSHNDCTRCHLGDEVEVAGCAACHPTDDPGTCNLVGSHGTPCLTCHNECVPVSTTTTTSPFADHITLCLDCHVPDDLHAIKNHSTCAQCHEGTIVKVSTCIVCHPTEGPGTCPLAIKHGNSCLNCHSNCTEDTTTTTAATVTSTTTTISGIVPEVNIDITTRPKGAFRSHVIPLPLLVFIEGTDSNFNQSTEVTFDGDVLRPPRYVVLSPARLLVFSIISPAGFRSSYDNEVSINVRSIVDSTKLGVYEEVGSCNFIFTTLPAIFRGTHKSNT